MFFYQTFCVPRVFLWSSSQHYVLLNIDWKIPLICRQSCVGGIPEYAPVSSNKQDADTPAEMPRKLCG